MKGIKVMRFFKEQGMLWCMISGAGLGASIYGWSLYLAPGAVNFARRLLIYVFIDTRFGEVYGPVIYIVGLVAFLAWVFGRLWIFVNSDK